MARVEAFRLAAAAQVVVGAGEALVAEADDGALAAVAGDAGVLLAVAVASRARQYAD